MADLKEIILKTARAGINTVTGGSLFSEFYQTPKEKRLIAYLDAFDKLVSKLENVHNIKSGELAKRDDFLDILYGTTNLWLINSDSNKLKSIFSFLENVAVNPTADGALDAMVLRTLGDLSGSHIQLLLKHRNNCDYVGVGTEFREMMGPKGWSSDWGIVYNDLKNMRLLGPGGLTPFGKALIGRILIEKSA